MSKKWIKMIAGLTGVTLVSTFVIGLSYSISVGFAGFWGGFPFAVIITSVLLMAVYDVWDECIRKNN